MSGGISWNPDAPDGSLSGLRGNHQSGQSLRTQESRIESGVMYVGTGQTVGTVMEKAHACVWQCRFR